MKWFSEGERTDNSTTPQRGGRSRNPRNFLNNDAEGLVVFDQMFVRLFKADPFWLREGVFGMFVPKRTMTVLVKMSENFLHVR